VDPIYQELKAAYGEEKMYIMHWLLDVDDNFGFGNVQGQCEAGPSAGGPSFVHMGSGSVWQGITYPACDNFKYGGTTGFSVSNHTDSRAPFDALRHFCVCKQVNKHF